MWMDASLDTGDILLAAPLAIAPDDTAGTLIPRLADLGAGLLVETLDRHAAGRIERHPQDHAEATLAPAILPEDGFLDWAETAESLRNRIRGVNPKPGAFTSARGRRLKVWRADSLPGGDPADPGTVLSIEKGAGGIVVAAGGGVLRLIEIQPESGKRMSAAEWARGVHLTHGDRFSPLLPGPGDSI
jgi:methionyl-tRNA formyltransferase